MEIARWTVAAAFVFASFVSNACGAPPTAPAIVSPSAPAMSATSDRCVAAMSDHRPVSGWNATGKLVIALREGRPTKLEAIDETGKVVDSAPAPKQKKDAQQWIESATCRLGGMIAVIDGKPPEEGSATLIVMKPVAPNEKTDLAIMCEEPTPDDPRATPNLDHPQSLRIAVELFENRLTTAKWRVWLRDMTDELADKPSEARVPFRRTKADELKDDASKAGLSKCWFEAALRH